MLSGAYEFSAQIKGAAIDLSRLGSSSKIIIGFKDGYFGLRSFLKYLIGGCES
jgi:hypothetical protein